MHCSILAKSDHFLTQEIKKEKKNRQHHAKMKEMHFILFLKIQPVLRFSLCCRLAIVTLLVNKICPSQGGIQVYPTNMNLETAFSPNTVMFKCKINAF